MLVAAVAGLLIAAEPGSAQAPPAETFTVEGIRVLHRPTPGRRTVAVRVHILGGPGAAPDGMAGIEPLLLRTSGWGTEDLPGREARVAEADAGVRIFVSGEADWTVIGFDGLAAGFAPAWKALASRIVRPAFDSAGLEIERRRMITAARSQDDSPDAVVARMAADLAFRGHPYALSGEGDEGSLSRIAAADLRRYHAESIVRSRIAVVAVGDVPRAELEAAVREGLGGLPAGGTGEPETPAWSARGADVVVRERKLPTNYILGYFSGPPSHAADYDPFVTAVQVLGSFIHASLRAEGLTYAAGAPVIERRASGGGVYVSTREPERVMRIVNDVMAALEAGTFRRTTLQEAARQSELSYLMATETSGGAADFHARAWLLGGHVSDAATWVERQRRVEPGAVRRAAQEYFRNVRYAYLGDPALVPEHPMRRR
jgi:zinc protease